MRLWKDFGEAFHRLPAAAIIDDRIFCMHGGLSPALPYIDKINELQKPVEPPDQGLLCDLLWADPDKNCDGWGSNDRGVSFVFGKAVLRKFLKDHDLNLIVRAHQVVEEGYEFFGNRDLITLFSAPNYCGEFDNNACILTVDEHLCCSFDILKPLEKKALKKVISHKEATGEKINNIGS